MPYFKNESINLLFIHIPKTGGTSLELYFSKKIEIPLDKNCLCGFFYKERKESRETGNKLHNFYLFNNISLQHFTYQNLIENKDLLKIDFNNLKIITIVRNPYERLISDLFYYDYIDINSSKEKVFEIINIYLFSFYLDNHNLPQYRFIIDKDEKIINNISILKTENLCNDMKKLGYEDFDIYDHVNRNGKLNYYDYLNDDSISLINNFYEKDFLYFNYEKI